MKLAVLLLAFFSVSCALKLGPLELAVGGGSVGKKATEADPIGSIKARRN